MTDLVLRVQSRLTPRDHQLLTWLYDHGVLTTEQIANSLYPSLDFCQRRLLKLISIGVIDRFRPNKPDGGSYSYRYVIDQLGADVVSAQRGDPAPRRDQARNRRRALTSNANLPHLLGVNQFFTDLAGHARTHPETQLVTWWPAGRCQQMGAFAQQSDNISVRAYLPRIRPDGYGLWRDDNIEIPFFLEYDRGTETLGRLVDKFAGYTDLLHVTGRPFVVLLSLHAAARERNLHHQLAELRIPFPVATAARDDTLAPGLGPGDTVWWLHCYEGGLLHLGDLAPCVNAHDA